MAIPWTKSENEIQDHTSAHERISQKPWLEYIAEEVRDRVCSRALRSLGVSSQSYMQDDYHGPQQTKDNTSGSSEIKLLFE